ncbi:Glutathione-regulated potassium-efflux system protein KefC [Streptomyces griseus subsp. griseus]
MGCGRVGAALAQTLEQQGHTVAVIDQDPTAFRRLGSGFGGRRVTGVGFDQDTLREAGIEDAGAFAAVSSGDNSNIIAARVAREMFSIENVAARIYDPRRAEVYQRLGIPTVATVRWTADQMLRRLLPSGAEPLWRDPSGGVQLAEVHTTPSWIGHKISTLQEETGVRVAFLTRLGEAILPRLADRPPGGRPGPRDDAYGRDRQGRRGLRPGSRGGRSLMRVSIAGAGAVGRSIAAELLENGHEVLLIDKAPTAISVERVPMAEWLLADACEITSLDEAALQRCNVVIAATGDDKVNLVVSLLAKTEYGVPRVVARVNNPKNEWLFNESWGVDVAVSTPRLMSALVEEAVSVGDLVRLLRFSHGDANLVELTLPPESALAGTRVGDVAWPEDTSLVTIIRGTRVLTPSPEESLESGDELLFVAAQAREEQLEDLLSVRRDPSED